MSSEIMMDPFGLAPTRAELVIPPEMHWQDKDGEATRGSIRCYPSLHLINPFNAKPEDIFMEDIAHHLALMNRYAGASPQPISVAEHSVRVARRLAGHPIEYQLAGLLHDSEEAYFLDMPSPIKRAPQMHFYREASRRLRGVIFERFDVDVNLVEEIKWADEAEYHRERRDMWPLDMRDYRAPMPWHMAEAGFKSLFITLESARNLL
jgi:hypothetical protein